MELAALVLERRLDRPDPALGVVARGREVALELLLPPRVPRAPRELGGRRRVRGRDRAAQRVLEVVARPRRAAAADPRRELGQRAPV